MPVRIGFRVCREINFRGEPVKEFFQAEIYYGSHEFGFKRDLLTFESYHDMEHAFKPENLLLTLVQGDSFIDTMWAYYIAKEEGCIVTDCHFWSPEQLRKPTHEEIVQEGKPIKR